MINKYAQKKRAADDFDDDFQLRTYSDNELRDFDKKIKRFYKPKQMSEEMGGGTFLKFDYDEFAVAFGAFSKLLVGNRPYYRARADASGKTTRYRQMLNLLKQYDSWRIKQDFGMERQDAQLEKTAEEIPF
jgi:hypothetical protein